MNTSVEDALGDLKFGLTEVVYQWASGKVRYLIFVDFFYMD